MDKEHTPDDAAARGAKKLRRLLWALGLAVPVNLIFTMSLSGLIGGAAVLALVGLLHRGHWKLRTPLRILLFCYSAVNLLVLLAAVFYAESVSILSLVWLLLYSGFLLAAGILLGDHSIRDYLASAPPPEKKARKIQFFHGGWRDL